jgi:hypothetical protein
MKIDFTTGCGFCSAVLLGASFVCPGVAVLLAFLAVVPGALWLLDQCSETTTK